MDALRNYRERYINALEYMYRFPEKIGNPSGHQSEGMEDLSLKFYRKERNRALRVQQPRY